LRESLPGVNTRLSAWPSSTVQVTTSTSARGNALLPPPPAAPVRGARPLGHGTSV
jgi:hypothetical protein